MKLFIIVLLFSLISLSYSGNVGKDGIILKDTLSCGCRIKEPNSIPWIVELRDLEDKHLCTGTIINDESILTARLCRKGMEAENIKVLVGLSSVNSKENTDLSSVNSEKNTYFVDLIEELQFDIFREGLAILKLKRRIKFVSHKIEPACLNFNAREETFFEDITDKTSNFKYLKDILTGKTVLTIPRYKNQEKAFIKTSVVSKLKFNGNSNTVITLSNEEEEKESGGPMQLVKKGLVSIEGVTRVEEQIILKEGRYRIVPQFSVMMLSDYKFEIGSAIKYHYCNYDFIVNGKGKFDSALI